MCKCGKCSHCLYQQSPISPRFSVGQVWESNVQGQRYKIIAIESDCVVTRSMRTTQGPILVLWKLSGEYYYNSSTKLVKEYKETRKATRDIYLVYNPRFKGGEPYFLDVLKDADPDEGKCSSTVILGKVTLTITEGEGM